MNPKVSVLMPNYNCEKYIWEAIESILSQTFSDFEFIIIDDCSTDNSWKIIQEYVKKDKRIIAMRNEENLKICKTLNRWIEIAKWEYIARMDSDDISMKNRFQLQVDFLELHPEVWILWGTMEIMDEIWKVYSKREYNLTDEEIRKKIFRYSPFCHPVIMIRKNILKQSGLYDEKLVYSEDYDLYFRIGKYSKFANISNTLIKYRMFSWNTTTKKLKEMERGTIYIRKKAEKEYWYNMTLRDKLYNLLQKISIYVMPSRVKIWLFNLLRNSN